MTPTPVSNSTTVERHAQMVADLVKDPSLIFASLDIKKCALLHAAIGLAGEAFELMNIKSGDQAHAVEEIGDFLFYRRDLVTILGIKDEDIPFMVRPVIHGLLPLAVYATGEILDAVKKHVIYNQEINTDRILAALAIIEHDIGYSATNLGASIPGILEANIQKLTGPNGRYPSGKYSDADAAARADKAGEEGHE